jgi:hypothetical protein
MTKYLEIPVPVLRTYFSHFMHIFHFLVMVFHRAYIDTLYPENSNELSQREKVEKDMDHKMLENVLILRTHISKTDTVRTH